MHHRGTRPKEQLASSQQAFLPPERGRMQLVNDDSCLNSYMLPPVCVDGIAQTPPRDIPTTTTLLLVRPLENSGRKAPNCGCQDGGPLQNIRYHDLGWTVHLAHLLHNTQ